MKKHQIGYIGSTYKENINQDSSDKFTIGNFILAIVSWVLFIEFIGFVMWTLSVQTPPDGYYVGRLITEFIKLFI